MLERFQSGDVASSFRYGINITKTPDPDISGDGAIEDILQCFMKVEKYARYVTLNVSCPNTKEGKTFEQDIPNSLNKLIVRINDYRKTKDSSLLSPKLYLKISPPSQADCKDGEVLSDSEFAKKVDSIVELFIKTKLIDGLVLCNTVGDETSKRMYLNSGNTERGGLSGRPIFKNCLLPAIACTVKTLELKGVTTELTLVGGITSWEDINDIYDAMHIHPNKLSAPLPNIQLYTSMVYNGPGVIQDIQNAIIRSRRVLNT